MSLFSLFGLPYLFLLLVSFGGLKADAGYSFTSSPGDVFVDRPYGDLENMPITLNSTNSNSSFCKDLCKQNPECRGWVFGIPDCPFPGLPASCWLKGKRTGQRWNECRISGLKNITIFNEQFKKIPIGSIKPAGWLKTELLKEVQGLPGHLSQFWPDIMNSTWIGGNADQGLHERLPYLLNAFAILTFQVEDEGLRKWVDYVINYILEHQDSSGWMGPSYTNDAYWSRFPLLLSLSSYVEGLGDSLEEQKKASTIVDKMYLFLHEVHKMLFTQPLGLMTWSSSRYQDLLLTILWLRDNYSRDEDDFLFNLAEQLKEQGFDWKSWFGDKFPKEEVTSGFNLYTHGVNNAQAIKSEAVWWRYSGSNEDIQSTLERVKKLDKYHGAANGMFNCDEHLAGSLPSHGIELCTVAEAIFSYGTVFSILGIGSMIERAELISYNAFPATWSHEMWSHQYLQQTNEINAATVDPHVWITDGPDSTIYGLEPNFGCCTVNGPQGWPKFVSQMMYFDKDKKGLVLAMYGPIDVVTKFADRNEVSISVQTDYPFNETVLVEINSSTPFSMGFRIPSWSEQTSIILIANCNGPKKSYKSTPGEIIFIELSSGQNCVELKFQMEIRLSVRTNNAVSVYRGPLLYSLSMKQNYTILKSYSFDSKDYEVQPLTRWQYAINTTTLEFINLTPYVGSSPFSYSGSPVGIKVKGRFLPQWEIERNAAASPPMSPVTSNEPEEDLLLLPYGSTDLRITEIPTLNID